jgi:hypothetical protein
MAFEKGRLREREQLERREMGERIGTYDLRNHTAPKPKTTPTSVT